MIRVLNADSGWIRPAGIAEPPWRCDTCTGTWRRGAGWAVIPPGDGRIRLCDTRDQAMVRAAMLHGADPEGEILVVRLHTACRCPPPGRSRVPR